MIEGTTPELGACRETQVRSTMNILGAALSSTEDSARELLDRLNPILRDNIPKRIGGEEAQAGKEHELLVPLASDLKQLHLKAASTDETLIDILQRLEL